jgi:hypothetical protein
MSHTGKKRSAVEERSRGCLVTKRGKYRGQLRWGGAGYGLGMESWDKLGEEGGADGDCIVGRQVRGGRVECAWR